MDQVFCQRLTGKVENSTAVPTKPNAIHFRLCGFAGDDLELAQRITVKSNRGSASHRGQPHSRGTQAAGPSMFALDLDPSR